MSGEIDEGGSRGVAPGTTLGAVLVFIGLVLLAAQLLEIDWAELGWPAFIIAPGLAILAIGLTQRHGSGLTIGGSVVTIVGLLLLYQNLTGHWESWAYAWALVGPGGSGVGMLLHGARAGDASMARAGLWQVITALGIFAVGIVFFEGIIGISGRRLPLPDWALPALVIGVGVVVLVLGITSRRDERGEAA